MLSVLDCALETHKPMFPSVCLGKEIIQRELCKGTSSSSGETQKTRILFYLVLCLTVNL